MSRPNVSKQFHQLPMFLSPDDVRSMHSGDTGGPMEDWQYHTELFNDDPRHSDGDPGPYLHAMLGNIESNGGISEPVDAWSPGNSQPSVILDGNHRSVLGMETNRLVPVHWHGGEDDEEAFESMRREKASRWAPPRSPQ